MLKHISILFIILLNSISVNAIHVANNVDICIGLNMVSKYVYRGSCLSYENFQPYAKFCFGNDSTIGTFSVKPWLSIGHNITKKIYKEIDITTAYTTPGNYFTAALIYLHYMGMYEKQQNHELQVAAKINLEKIIPLSFVTETTIMSKKYLYDTNILLTYDGKYEMWQFIPSLGFRFGCVDYAYIQFDTRRNVKLSEKTNMFVQVSGNVNSYDIKDFTYQKNFNGWLTCGFLF